MNVRKFITIVLCVFGICLAVLSGVLTARHMLPDIMGGGGTGADFEGLTAAKPKGRVNILVLGVDMDNSRTDTMMLASLDNENKTLSVLSIPRDTRITYKGKTVKINSVHVIDGTDGTIKAVKDLTGLDIHYCAVINYKGFRDVIDALGGVYIDVPHIPNKWSKGRRGMYYDDPAQNLHIALPEGRHLLNGEQCEGFVRFRYGYANADIDRIGNQQYFLKELFEQKMQPKYILKANELFKIFNESVETNYTLKMMASHLLTLKEMTSDDIYTMSLPGEGKYIGQTSYFVHYPEEAKKMINEYFVVGHKKAETSETDTADTTDTQKSKN